MTVLVLGATGMTGRSVVTQLLANGYKVRVVVRSTHKILHDVISNPDINITKAAILDLSEEQLAEQVKDCTAIISCLGHNMDFKGIFAQPRQLCTDVVRRVCAAIEKQASPPVKFILMSSVGVTGPNDTNKRSLFDRALLFALRYTLPPHRDNETAAQYLNDKVGAGNSHVEWCCVRPDSLINAEVSPCQIISSPVTGITSGRPTARKNVAHFMIELVGNSNIWNKWKFKMPVIMNVEE